MRKPEYIQQTYPELEQLAKDQWHNAEILRNIEDELRYRSHKHSSWLKAKIRKRCGFLEYVTNVLSEQKGLDETKMIAEFCAPVFQEAFYPTHETTLEELTATLEQARSAAQSTIDQSLVSQFPPSERFKGKAIGCTGHDPLNQATLAAIIRSQSGYCDKSGIFAHCPIIVIGREKFDTLYLSKAIEEILAKDLTIHFLSQEDFLNYLQTDTITQYLPNDSRIADHPGLAYLSTIGFHWPVLSEPNYYGYGFKGDRYSNRRQHPLNTIFGYTVKNQTSKAERQAKLKNAIRNYPLGLGLHEVADHIADLINEFSQTQPERMDDAVFAWKQDLDWLKTTYYDCSIYRFIWPFPSK